MKRRLVSKYKHLQTGVWYLRYAKSIGLPRRSTATRDESLAELLRVNEEHKYLFARHGIKDRPVTKIRYSAFVNLFMRHCEERGLALNTLNAYRSALSNFGATLSKDMYVSEITLSMLEHFAGVRRGNGRKEKTIRNELIILSTALKWAKREHFVLESPTAALKLPKKIVYPPRYLRDNQYADLMGVIDDPVFSDIINLYLLTGMRRKEGLQLRAKEHVDLEHNVIYVPQGKTRDFKPLPMAPVLRSVVQRMLARADDNGQMIHMHEDTITARFREYAKKAELPANITFHALRHTFATRLASMGVPFPVIQELLGQSDPQSTRIYTHAYDGQLVQALAKLKLPKAHKKKRVPRAAKQAAA